MGYFEHNRRSFWGSRGGNYAFWLYLRVLVLGVGFLLGVLQVLAGGAAGGLQALESLLLGGIAHLGALLGRLLGSSGSLVLQILYQGNQTLGPMDQDYVDPLLRVLCRGCHNAAPRGLPKVSTLVQHLQSRYRKV